MSILYHRLSFVLELIFSGSFILLYFLSHYAQGWPIWQVYSLESAQTLLTYLVYGVPLSVSLTVIGHFMTYCDLEQLMRKSIFSVILLFPIFVVWSDQEFTFWLGLIHLLSSISSLSDPVDIKNKKKNLNIGFYSALHLNPAQLIMSTFFILVLLGTSLLSIPLCHQEGQVVSLVDNLFIATSAICVTGLASVNVAEVYSPIGQVVIIALAQVGGLGIMTLSSCFALLVGRSLAMKEKVLMQGLLEVNSMEDLLDMIVAIVKMALIIEFWGGIALSVAFYFSDMEMGPALFAGFFHSISAFCQAGFSIFPNSLADYRTDVTVNVVVSSLLILGGLGFLVLSELKTKCFQSKKRYEFSLHTKVVLVMNLALILIGGISLFLGEFLNPASLDQYSFGQKIMISFFHAISARTGGLSTVDLVTFNQYIIFFLMLLMIIGAAPGSSGGGMKVTTFAILLQTIRSTLKGSNRVEMFGRSLQASLIIKASALAVVFIAGLCFFLMLMLNTDSDKNFFHLTFEVVSAFCTVGYSLGITEDLSSVGKVILSFAMFIGRVGPLTMVLAIGEGQRSQGRVSYPEGKIMIG